MYNEVVHLKPVDLREVWPNEADNFTPWLEEPEHLSWLGEALNMKLADAKREVNVGQFRADIMCSNTVDDSVVVIENQYGESDHEHLGKILTYATGLEARALVWVAASFTDEHRETISRLNAMPPEHFQIFGVEIKGWKIAGSTTYGVEFNVVVKPNDRWQPQLPADFWSEFSGYLVDKNSLLVDRLFRSNRPEYHGVNFEPSSDEIWLAAWLDLQSNRVAANLHLRGKEAEFRYDFLKDEKSIEIEFDLGEEENLEWWRSTNPEKVPCRIGFYRDIANPIDKADWGNHFEWLRLKLENLDDVFQPLLTETGWLEA